MAIEELQARIDGAQLRNGHDDSQASFDTLKPFAVFGLSDFPPTPPSDIVQRLYGHGHVIAMVGPPNAGKTALGVDHALAIAARESWFGLKVSGGPVAYFAPEAPTSVVMRARAAALAKYPDRRLPFYIATSTPELGGEISSMVDAERILATIRIIESQEGEILKLVVLDTLASCLGGGEENGDGMIRLVGASKYIAAAGPAVMLIHHPAKGDSSGLRGHGSLAAACDTIITIAADEVSGVRTATLVKSRDSATGLQLSYSLEPVKLAEPDSFGDPRTTIIVKSTAVRQSRPRPKGKRQQDLLAELERRHRTGETGWPEADITAAGRTLGIAPQSSRDALKGLINAGYVWGTSTRLTLKYPPDEAVK